ncbi:MAG: hypothetical protein ACRDZR_12980, partial [Acidimicrobiales bacterium]
MLSKEEILWRHLLVEAVEHENRRSSISELAGRFGYASSTVHRSLVVPRQIGAVESLRRGLVVRDPMRLLLHWAAKRRLQRDHPFKVHTGMTPIEVQEHLPDDAVVTGAAAYGRRYRNDVADFPIVYCYHPDPDAVLARVPDKLGSPDLVVLDPDPFLADYGRIASVPQMYVDLFGTPGWEAQRFLHRMNERLEMA